MKVMKPMAPKLRGQHTLYKPVHLIKPIVNFRNSPPYKLSKYLEKIIKREINLQPTHNVKNTQELIRNSDNIDIEDGHKLVSFDITNLYGQRANNRNSKKTTILISRRLNM